MVAFHFISFHFKPCHANGNLYESVLFWFFFYCMKGIHTRIWHTNSTKNNNNNNKNNWNTINLIDGSYMTVCMNDWLTGWMTDWTTCLPIICYKHATFCFMAWMCVFNCSCFCYCYCCYFFVVLLLLAFSVTAVSVWNMPTISIYFCQYGDVCVCMRVFVLHSDSIWPLQFYRHIKVTIPPLMNIITLLKDYFFFFLKRKFVFFCFFFCWRKKICIKYVS